MSKRMIITCSFIVVSLILVVVFLGFGNFQNDESKHASDQNEKDVIQKEQQTDIEVEFDEAKRLCNNVRMMS